VFPARQDRRREADAFGADIAGSHTAGTPVAQLHSAHLDRADGGGHGGEDARDQQDQAACPLGGVQGG